MVTQELFFRGLMLALRQYRDRFVFQHTAATTRAFQRALACAIKRPTFGKVAEEMLEDFDPVFGHFPSWELLVRAADRDLLIETCSSIAVFRLSEQEALEKLKRLDDCDAFLEVAAELHAQLTEFPK